MKEDKLHANKTTGYKTPKHYFNAFNDNLFERLTAQKTKKTVETSGYKVPKDYFNTIDNAIFSKLNTKVNTSVISLKSRKTFYYITGIAASFTLLFSVFINTKEVKSTLSLNTINTVAIERYLQLEDYTNDDLATLFNANEISETDFIDLTISDETLNQYIESIDTEDFILD